MGADVKQQQSKLDVRQLPGIFGGQDTGAGARIGGQV